SCCRQREPSAWPAGNGVVEAHRVVVPAVPVDPHTHSREGASRHLLWLPDGHPVATDEGPVWRGIRDLRLVDGQATWSAGASSSALASTVSGTVTMSRPSLSRTCVVIAVLAGGDNEPAASARSPATTRRYAY